MSPKKPPTATLAGRAGELASRDRNYLVAQDTALSPLSAGPLDFDWVVEQLRNDPAVVVEQELHPRSFTLAAAGPSITQTVVVATMPEATKMELAAHPQLIVEEDYPVLPQDVAPAAAPPVGDPLLVSPFGVSTSWQIVLSAADGSPIDEATVYLYGNGIPAQGRTDSAGQVVLTLQNETDDTLRALYVNPLRDYWSMWVNRPNLTSGLSNTVVLESLSATFPGFPDQQLLGWGQTLMRLDAVPSEFDGRGISVAVIDSGAASLTHGDLKSIKSGVDFTGTETNTVGWKQDTIAHGSHCSGIIAGSDDGRGIRGFAPAAEMHELRIFPGGRVSSLLDAVDYCIDQQMDVVNMSLGTGGTSQILLQKLAQAREQGVACIVAAGNSGDAVQFPGLSPDVLTVAAIGQDGTFPEGSYHAQQRWKDGVIDGGLFSAQFSCHGPEIDVCGPGVAIVSSVPDNGYAAWDGTSMATPHVAGLAALVLAHHPDFQAPAMRVRTAARVDRLFEILRESAAALAFGDPERSGAGVPDAVKSLGLEGAPTHTGGGAAAMPEDRTAGAIRLALDQLLQDLVAVGLSPAAGADGAAASDVLAIRRLLAGLRADLMSAGLGG
jgi:subtilisin